VSRRKLIAVIVAVFLWQVSVGVLNLVYTNYVDSRWCGLLSTLDDAYNSSPVAPQSAIGQRLAHEVHERRQAGHC
jgi:hypothetical protein